MVRKDHTLCNSKSQKVGETVANTVGRFEFNNTD